MTFLKATKKVERGAEEAGSEAHTGRMLWGECAHDVDMS